jgi:hypothetical protein
MLQKNFETEYVRIMQVRNEVVSSEKRHSVIDEESEEELATEIVIKQQVSMNKRGNSVQSSDDIHADDNSPPNNIF